MSYTYEYPRPMVTTDIVVFAGRGDKLEVLLIRRGIEPFAGCWALPGGFLEMGEDLVDCAKRELQEETGLAGLDLKELFTIGTPGRDPRGRVISVIFFVVIDQSTPDVKGGDDATDAAWFRVDTLREMAFDHAEILLHARKRLSL